MIYVQPIPEPALFDEKVRQKGLAYLKREKIPLNAPLPTGSKIAPYWRDCLDDLHDSYQGICAYLAVFFEKEIGAGSVDHFIAKSDKAGLAYEWSNFRLACMTMNSRKWRFADTLDPFTVVNGWFHLELITGHIFPCPTLDGTTKSRIISTIERLKLNDYNLMEMRARHYQEYRQEYFTENYLKTHSPFVWMEANRQKLL